MAGYLALCAMVLQSVDELSDEGDANTPQPKATPMPPLRPGSKGPMIPPPSKTPKSKPKASKKTATETGESGSLPVVKKPAANASSVMKKPAASKLASNEKPDKVSVSKGLYKNGMYGSKINGQEKLRVLQRHAFQLHCEATSQTSFCETSCQFFVLS